MATVRGLDFEEAAGAFANKAILRPITNVRPRDVIKTDDYEGNADEAEDEVGEVAHDEACGGGRCGGRQDVPHPGGGGGAPDP